VIAFHTEFKLRDQDEGFVPAASPVYLEGFAGVLARWLLIKHPPSFVDKVRDATELLAKFREPETGWIDQVNGFQGHWHLRDRQAAQFAKDSASPVPGTLYALWDFEAPLQ
jgi:hypothetical protein